MSRRWTIEDVERLQANGLTIRDITKPTIVPENKPSAKERVQALGRMKAGRMNRTEEKYAAHLDKRKLAGEVLDYWFEPMNLRLATKCFYKVDFLVMLYNGALEVHEVKGFWTDDALVKIKVAAEHYPFRFVAIQFIEGSWIERDFL